MVNQCGGQIDIYLTFKAQSTVKFISRGAKGKLSNHESNAESLFTTISTFSSISNEVLN